MYGVKVSATTVPWPAVILGACLASTKYWHATQPLLQQSLHHKHGRGNLVRREAETLREENVRLAESQRARGVANGKLQQGTK